MSVSQENRIAKIFTPLGDDAFLLTPSEEPMFTRVGGEATDHQLGLRASYSLHGLGCEFNHIQDASHGQQVGDLCVPNVHGHKTTGDFGRILHHAPPRGPSSLGE